MKRALPRTVWLLGLTSLFTDIAGDMVFPLLPLLLGSMSAGATALGLVEGLSDAVASLFKYFGGRWSDRAARRKPLVLVGYLIATVTRPLLGLTGAVWQVVSLRAIDRVGKGVRSAPRDALLAQSVDAEDSGRAFGLHQAMDHTGAVIGPLLASGLLALGASVQTALLVTVVPGLLSVLTAALVNEPAVPVTAVQADITQTHVPAGLKRLLLVFFIFGLGNSSDAFLLVRAKQLGLAVPLVPILWVVLHLSKMVWALVGGALSDRMPRHRLIIAGWLLFSTSYVGFAAATHAWLMWPLVVLYGAFYGLTEPVEKALIKDLVPAASRGRAFGLYHATLGAAAIPASLITGALWERVNAETALLTGAALALVSAVALAVMRPVVSLPESP